MLYVLYVCAVCAVCAVCTYVVLWLTVPSSSLHRTMYFSPSTLPFNGSMMKLLPTTAMMNEQQRQTLMYVVYCVCFIVRVQCTAVCVEYAAVYVFTLYNIVLT